MAASGRRPRGALSATYRWAREVLGSWRTLRADSVKYPLCAALRLDEGRYTTTVTHVVGLIVTYVPDRSHVRVCVLACAMPVGSPFDFATVPPRTSQGATTAERRKRIPKMETIRPKAGFPR